MKKIILSLSLTLISVSLISQTIAAGWVHSLAICSDIVVQKPLSTQSGISVMSWGFNNYGELGDNTNGSLTCMCGSANCCKNAPVQVTGLTNMAAVAAGSDHSLFLKNNGTAWACGRGQFGQLGNGGAADLNTPTQVSLTNVVAISAGGNHSLFLKSDGTVWASGYNFDGELGDGTTAFKLSPVQVSGLSGIIAIAGGEKHSIFLKNDGTVWACGYNAYGQLGDGTLIKKTTPFQIAGLANIVAIGCGDMHSLFVKNDGTVYACGSNNNGQCGDGTSMNNKTTPVLCSVLTGITAVDGGYQYSLFLKSDGTVWATGQNNSGSFANGTLVSSIVPIQTPLTNVKTISAGASHSMFLKNDGTLKTCGSNYRGQLGEGSYTNETTAVSPVNLCILVVTSLNDLSGNEDKFKIYPTVSNGVFNIESDVKCDEITVYNVQGQKVYEDNRIQFPYILNTSNSNDGIYLIQIRSGQTILNKRVIIVK